MPPTATSSTMTRPRGPTHDRGASPTECTASRVPSNSRSRSPGPGRALPGGVIYELHIGTFTPEGTLDSAIERLDHLVDLGVDFVEVLPVNAFNGTHNWGYDGVLWYAVQETLRRAGRLPAASSTRATRAGSRWCRTSSTTTSARAATTCRSSGPTSRTTRNTWGDSINLDGRESDEVRRYIIDNALMWLRDYGVDALRLDAVHALLDEGETHLLKQLATEVDALAAELGRPLTLIAESDLNDPKLITPAHARAATGSPRSGATTTTTPRT